MATERLSMRHTREILRQKLTLRRSHAERRKPGVTLELLHLEYLEQHPDGYRYTQFCELYRNGWAAAGEDRVDFKTAPALSVPLEQHDASAAQRAQGLDQRPLTPVAIQAS